ncbi:uncharacterized protein LOC112685059 isoform X2 [Sipha flava]|jgi:hypothetical protein|nr:uncharacterized protein LOC112685059 isoform X2 [Sipha flava]
MKLVCLISIVICFAYADASPLQIIAESVLIAAIKTYKAMEMFSFNQCDEHHSNLLRDWRKTNEDYYKTFTNISKQIADELEYQTWSSKLFLNNMDLGNNKIFFQNGTCRHDAYEQYVVLYEYYDTDTKLHPSRLDPFFARLNKTFDDEIGYLRSENSKLKRKLEMCQMEHDLKINLQLP